MISLSPACTGSSAGCQTAPGFSPLGAEPRRDELRGQWGANLLRAGLGCPASPWALLLGLQSPGWREAAGAGRGLQGVDGVTSSPPHPGVFLQTYTKEDRLIITQLPFPTTLVDFWALVWDYTCTSVVVLNQLQELDEVSR